jgi:crotonobetainyl-CoA:carnitine CoA-transferase CaiB-like acyl-CoA transferase
MLMCQTPKFWEAFCDRVGRPDLASDSRFSDIAGRRQNLGALTETLDALLQTRDSSEWISLLGGHVPVAPVFDIAQALDNPFVGEVGMQDVVEHPDAKAGELRMLASPIKINGQRTPGRRAPKLGEHT